MKRSRLFIATLGSLIIISAIGWAVCPWNLFPNHCADESCGFGCSIIEYGTLYQYCSQTMSDECCRCLWQTTTCQCLFGYGHGIECDAFAFAPHVRCCAPLDPDGGMPGLGFCALY